MPDRVLVSGASGFIASHTIAQLLDQGFEVVGTVRDPGNVAKTAHLTGLPGAAERLTLVAADLNDAGAFDAHVGDVDHVLHMASPYVLTVKDAQRDLVDPAVNGTLAMMRAAAGCDRIKRVVLTSSMAAVTDEPDCGKVLTEDDWNTRSSLDRNPYYFSKTRAERAAWTFMDDEKPRWDLVAINPFLVIGPAMTSAINTSNQILVDLLKGQYPAIMSLNWGMVDVRDVAAAHIAAMTSDRAKGRYICAAGNRDMRQIVDFLRGHGYARSKLPSMAMDTGLGNKLAYLASYTQPPGVGSYLRTHLGRVPRFDNTKIKADLGIAFRDLDATIGDTVADLARWGHIPEAA